MFQCFNLELKEDFFNRATVIKKQQKVWEVKVLVM